MANLTSEQMEQALAALMTENAKLKAAQQPKAAPIKAADLPSMTSAEYNTQQTGEPTLLSHNGAWITALYRVTVDDKPSLVLARLQKRNGAVKIRKRFNIAPSVVPVLVAELQK